MIRRTATTSHIHPANDFVAERCDAEKAGGFNQPSTKENEEAYDAGGRSLDTLETASVLLICTQNNRDGFSRVTDASGPDDYFRIASSGSQAIAMLRVMPFDLLVTSLQVPDMTSWQMIQGIRSVCPWQKWALVDPAIETADEIRARSLGAVALFDAMPPPNLLIELAGNARRRGRIFPAGMPEAFASRGGERAARRRRIAATRHQSVPGTCTNT